MGVPETTCRLSDGLGRLAGLSIYSHAVIYSSDRIQIKTSKGRRCAGKVQQKSGTSFPESSPNGVPQDSLISPAVSCDNMCCGGFVAPPA